MNCLPGERIERIKARIDEVGRVSAIDLAQEFGTSEDTIRRDLRDLAAAGLCRRIYGGALKIAPYAVPLRDRLGRNVEAKAALARAAASLVEADQTLFIDTGSTNAALAAALPRDLSLTVVTNAPAVAAALAHESRCTLVVLGGRIDPVTGGSFGPRAAHDLEDIQCDLCFIGICAVSAEHGLAVFDAEEAAFKRLLVSRSRRVVVMATTDKLATTAPFRFAPMAAVDTLVLETGASFPVQDEFRALHILNAAAGAA